MKNPEGIAHVREKAFSSIVLAPGDNCAFSVEGGESIHLEPQEFRLLLFLKKKEGQIATREEIADFFHGKEDDEEEFPFNSNLIEKRASSLRKKLEDSSAGRFSISALKTMGYQLVDAERPDLASTVVATLSGQKREQGK